MNESRKMINWMAGVTTFVVALLIVIVLLDTEQDGVSLAAASRTVALTLESESGILENAPETSNFDEKLSDQWYVKYMDYLYGQGYLDSGVIQADERSATSAVTYAVLSDWAKKASEKGNGKPMHSFPMRMPGTAQKKQFPAKISGNFMMRSAQPQIRKGRLPRSRRIFTGLRTMWTELRHGRHTQGTGPSSLRDFIWITILTGRSGSWRETMRS